MKNLMLPLIAVLLFAACQNSTTPAPETTTENVDAAATTIDPAELKASVSKANDLLQTMISFNSELTAASKSMTEAQINEVEIIRSQLNDVMSKQEMLTKGLESAANSGSQESSSLSDSAVPTTETIKDYMRSGDRYKQFLANLRAQLEAIKSGKSKGQ